MQITGQRAPVSTALLQRPYANRPSLRFAGSNRLFQEFGIAPKDVTVVAPSGVTLNKTQILTKLLEAHEQALKNKLLGNLSGRQFATNIQLENGQWGLATNIENTGDNVFCGERSAMVSAWNQALRKLSLSTLKNPQDAEKIQQTLKAKMLVMANPELGSKTAGSPCSECQSWLATDRYFSPDTLIVSLRQDDATSKPYIFVRRVQDLLPFLGKTQPSLSNKPVQSLPIQVSEKAKAAIAQKGLSTDALKDLMQQAKSAYLANPTAVFTGKHQASAALFANGKTAQGSRFDWTQRWFEPSDLPTVSKAAQAFIQNGNPTPAQAIAYYGSDPNTPAVKSLGVLGQPAHGDPDMLILVIENDTLQVRAIQDYMTDLYVSPVKPAYMPKGQ